ncbi:hypothetical protein CEXT_657351 [Caerostris extrusa]|uniref:Uncharacterized protein n=1 Tax=Caerostris extrusa TaxID=172846 RepID=A0AAV4V0V3_CAEEX|nr:hypothetical protein CEXT_657351 [Caerostris extrusa]
MANTDGPKREAKIAFRETKAEGVLQSSFLNKPSPQPPITFLPLPCCPICKFSTNPPPLHRRRAPGVELKRIQGAPRTIIVRELQPFRYRACLNGICDLSDIVLYPHAINDIFRDRSYSFEERIFRGFLLGGADKNGWGLFLSRNFGLRWFSFT